MAGTAAFGDLDRELRVCTGLDPGLGGKPWPKAAETPGFCPECEAQPGSPHPRGIVVPSPKYSRDVPPGAHGGEQDPRDVFPPHPGPDRGFLCPELAGPILPPPPASAPPKYQTVRSINSRVACQVHSLTSRITHAKPQVFYETFPVMKTFLWGFIFFFPSSSPLLLLLPVGWWPARGQQQHRPS